MIIIQLVQLIVIWFFIHSITFVLYLDWWYKKNVYPISTLSDNKHNINQIIKRGLGFLSKFLLLFGWLEHQCVKFHHSLKLTLVLRCPHFLEVCIDCSIPDRIYCYCVFVQALPRLLPTMIVNVISTEGEASILFMKHIRFLKIIIIF